MGLSEKLQEALEYKISFTIPILGGIPVPKSAVITWCIMAFLIIGSIVCTRKLKLVPDTKRQLAIEGIVDFISSFLYSNLGKNGRRYMPYLGTIMLFLVCANCIGIFGIEPPTKDLNVTAALAIMSIIVVEYANFHHRRVKGFFRSFLSPTPVMLPMNIMEMGIRPLSLCMRLFGNILGSYIIMEMIFICVPVGIPLVLSLYFDIFDGCLQAYVFCFLTALFIHEATE